MTQICIFLSFLPPLLLIKFIGKAIGTAGWSNPVGHRPGILMHWIGQRRPAKGLRADELSVS